MTAVVTPRDTASHMANGVVCSVKYAVDRKNPEEDRYLAAVIGARSGWWPDRRPDRINPVRGLSDYMPPVGDCALRKTPLPAVPAKRYPSESIASA